MIGDGPIVGPGRLPEAGLGGFAQWPDREVLGAGELLGVPVVRALAGDEREAEGLDVEPAGVCCIRSDDGDGSDEEDVHVGIDDIQPASQVGDRVIKSLGSLSI
jgi:hypothetical protein